MHLLDKLAFSWSNYCWCLASICVVVVILGSRVISETADCFEYILMDSLFND